LWHEVSEGKLLLAALREIQRLREQLNQAGEVLTKYEEQPAPSQPELTNGVQVTADDVECAEEWSAEVDDAILRREFIKTDSSNRALVREIQRLRQSMISLGIAFDPQMDDGVAGEWIHNERAEKEEQQLAQIRSAKGEMPTVWVCRAQALIEGGCAVADVEKIVRKNAQTIAALRQDNAQKDVHEIAVAALIAAAKEVLQYESDCHGECTASEGDETCWWRKMRIAIEQLEAQKDARIRELEGGKACQ
jgi:hypothetical protein